MRSVLNVNSGEGGTVPGCFFQPSALQVRVTASSSNRCWGRSLSQFFFWTLKVLQHFKQNKNDLFQISLEKTPTYNISFVKLHLTKKFFKVWNMFFFFFYPPTRGRSCLTDALVRVLSWPVFPVSRISAAPSGSWPWRAACHRPSCGSVENGPTSCSLTTRRTSPSSEGPDRTTISKTTKTVIKRDTRFLSYLKPHVLTDFHSVGGSRWPVPVLVMCDALY